MTETLFSLEIHIESVENLKVSCKLPAFCFRLLDFPTMIIHHVSPVEAEKLRQRLRLEDKDTLLHELKDRFGNFQFRKGKSCLFKASIDTLLVQLQTVPLYAMLMDLWPRKPTLVGSTLIPLKKAVDKIGADVYQKGIAVPSLYRDEGVFEVYNLMGSSIATVKLGFRLLSLGGTLIPHIPTEALATKPVRKVEEGGKVEQAVKSALEKVLSEIDSKSVLEEEIAGDTTESKTDGEQDAALQKQDNKHNVEIQTNIHARDIKSSGTLDHSRRESEEDVVITNTYCPPPLYYNCFSNSAPSNQSSSGETKVHRKIQAVPEDAESDVDFVYYDPGLVLSDGTVKLASVSVQTDAKLPFPTTVGQGSSENQAELLQGLYNLKGLTPVSRLPILNALLQELSCLTGGQLVTDTAQSKSSVTSGHLQKASTGNTNSQVLRKPSSATKSEVHKKQIQSVTPSKRAQSSVIGLSNRRVRFKQTSLTYGMTKTQKMRLELNQKDKLANRTRPCEAQKAVSEKENIKRDSVRAPLRESELGMTYRIGSAKRSTVTGIKHSADAQIQTQPPVEQQGYSTPNMKEVTDVLYLKEEIPKTDGDIVHSPVQSARNSKSPNSLEVFIPQVQGEPEERSDQEGEWATDEQPPGGFYGQTGIINSEYDDRGGGSAMTMYTEDFEDSATEDSQTSLHLAFTRHDSTENKNLKQRSNDDSSMSERSQGSSVSSTRPVKSSRSPAKTKSRRPKIKESERVEHKIVISQEDDDSSEDWARKLAKGSSEASIKQAEENEGSYTDDFHSVALELDNNLSDAASVDSLDARQHGVLDLPPAANNLGYTY